MNHIAVICSEFNKKLVEELYCAAEKEFKDHSQFFSSHYPQCALKQTWAPGAGEIPLTAKWLIEQNEKLASSPCSSKTQEQNRDSHSSKIQEQNASSRRLIGVLALGVIIKGQTGHYDFLKSFLQKALWDLQKTYSLPILFSVLLLENREQAQARIVRAKETMNSLIQMIKLKQSLSTNS